VRATAAEDAMRNWRRMMALAFPLAFLVSRLYAQGGATGSISGIVEDAEGGVIPGATVSAVYESTREVVRTQTADAAGLFTLTLFPAGTYTLHVNAANFADAKALGVVVRVTETTRLTIILPVRPGHESVVVQADVLPIKTANATTGESMTGRTITELPLATQNFQQLLALSAGTQMFH
jgi:hypothetical protein